MEFFFDRAIPQAEQNKFQIAAKLHFSEGYTN